MGGSWICATVRRGTLRYALNMRQTRKSCRGARCGRKSGGGGCDHWRNELKDW